MSVRSALRRTPLLLYQKRAESTVASFNKDELMLLLKPPLTKWSNIIREAEKVVDYPTSFMNLRRILSDEFSNLALYLRKLVGNNYLVMQTAKNVLYGDTNNLQPWGLVILLLSKSVIIDDLNPKKIYEQQRKLAELTEMMRSGHMIHKSIVNVPYSKRSKNTESAIFGNKIAILLGDYLLVSSNGMLASLRNCETLHIISSALRDVSESEFFGERDEQNKPLPGKPKDVRDELDLTFDTRLYDIGTILGKSRREWTARTIYDGVSLLGRGCQAAMVLAKQNREVESFAYNFGCHVGLAWQGAIELQALTSETKNNFSLTSAPVLFALESNPDLYKIIERAKNDLSNVDFEDLKFNILKTDSVEKTKILCEAHAKKATSYLDCIGQNESADMLKKLINTL